MTSQLRAGALASPSFFQKEENMSETVRKWGYKKGESKIFELPADKAALPKGWYESPADIPAKAPKKEPEQKTDSDDAGDAE